MAKSLIALRIVLSILMVAGVAAAQDTLPGPPAPRFGIRFWYEEALGGKVVTGQPFSATSVTERIQVLADGNKIDQSSTAKEYRDSEGRTRRERASEPLGPWGSGKVQLPAISLNDPVAGVGYLLDSTNKVAFKHPLRGPAEFNVGYGKMGAMSASTGGVAGVMVGGAEEGEKKTEDLGMQVIQGVSAQGTRTTITIPAGTIGNQQPIVIEDEKWTAPDLQLVVASKHNDPRFGEVDFRLTNIVRAEPDPSLFQVPSDYTVKAGKAFFQSKVKSPGGD